MTDQEKMLQDHEGSHPMTSLDRARAHLLICQELLRDMRRLFASGLEEYEDYFLAALSWVNDEQVKVCGCKHCEGQCCDYVAEPQ